MNNYRYMLLFFVCLQAPSLHTQQQLTIVKIINESSRSIYIDQINKVDVFSLEDTIIPNLICHIMEYSTSSFEISPSYQPIKIKHLYLASPNNYPIYIATSHYIYKLIMKQDHLYAQVLLTIENKYILDEFEIELGELESIPNQNQGNLQDIVTDNIILKIDEKERLSIVVADDQP